MLTSALLSPPSKTPCELWLDAGVLHQRTTFPSSQASNLLSFVAMEHTVSSTPFHGAWTPAPLSTRLSIECKCTAPQIETPTCTRRTTYHQFIWQQQRTCGTLGGWPMECEVGRLPSKTPHVHLPHTRNDPPKKKPGSGLTAFARTNRVWPPLRPVSVAQKNKPMTKLSFNVQSIDVLMDCTAWQFWTMRESNGCTTPSPRSSADKQWIARTQEEQSNLTAPSV